MNSKRIDLNKTIDINTTPDIEKFVLVPKSEGGITLAWRCSGHKPVTVSDAIKRIMWAEEEVERLQRGINGMWKLIDEAHNTTQGE